MQFNIQILNKIYLKLHFVEQRKKKNKDGEENNLPAFINKQKDHKTEKTTESRCDSDPGHNIISFVKFNFKLLPLTEGRRRFWPERR